MEDLPSIPSLNSASMRINYPAGFQRFGMCYGFGHGGVGGVSAAARRHADVGGFGMVRIEVAVKTGVPWPG